MSSSMIIHLYHQLPARLEKNLYSRQSRIATRTDPYSSDRCLTTTVFAVHICFLCVQLGAYVLGLPVQFQAAICLSSQRFDP